MSPEETLCFKLLDGHARTKHACFLAEFFPKGRRDGFYLCCFRPVGKADDVLDLNALGKEDDLEKLYASKLYACKYVAIDPGTMQSIVSNRSLPSELQQLLDEELQLLRAKS